MELVSISIKHLFKVIYNPEKQIDIQNAKTKLNWFIENNKLFELKAKRKRRTLSQNNYLHLILTWFGLQTGYTLNEVKQDIFKEVVNPELFYDGEKEGIVTIQKWRSTADLNTRELTLAINRFRDFSSQKAGIYLPEPKDLALLQEIEIEVSKNSNKQYV